ncbi:cellulose synthase/poly-beta-1,6-N-acetylglucosamine synthase-like glycosyltransferase [Leeuwenhoekiella aestuarii]|uniref:Cellulose synthase/poly-beta-1,6-N-acetylglucosamine synthase-like glycosyltransferase n=1 Tax=Leeuwenhoekiella aestuarii TaxID=2249426 RepID=A0A4Q0NVF1_9FLAO|nr:glycosyltransferase [Leeuwenhoekiella aestuarii]RXG15508.1 cellulose synthase/poly-beta-1,6-N-acetylglucosamine synthase-like glycosyltransferase [Leeuwenhoekiella aestuarii]RXG17385.1 cellulose synthase/poly-beta-1,6-N-acetylglucosamine synthase-like glycosyltransferase [Leeuwenhoekiella aestuarii]
MLIKLSIIIPVYNRPQEVQELLESFKKQNYAQPYEIVIVEDGSTKSSEKVCKAFKDLNITYLFKDNSGPGASRNYGMQRALGNYFIILDSDCVLPENYLKLVSDSLNREFIDFFGGPDAAHKDFTSLQKSINYAMTSLFTTGGIRGRKEGKSKFEPRSFNMGISKEAFEASGGFGKIHPGEDPDLSIRLWGLGFDSKLIPEAFVYHKRRISWSKFYIQVKKFGTVRPVLTSWHPQTAKLTYWFPTCFTLGLILAFILAMFEVYLPVLFVLGYLILIALDSTLKNKSLSIGLLSVWAVLVQFVGYGFAFLESKIKIGLLKKDPLKEYPHLFFK